MLDIDKSTVDFLVTENMVQEVEKVLSHDVPLVHTIVEEMVKRDIDRIYFVACGSPL
ncbi:TPA: fructoselysine-6-P-deglycase, partial [Escherichia coli]